jgi:O-methyltransferase
MLQLYREIADGSMLCAGRVANIVHYLLQTSALLGDMVEFGCHTGRTSTLMAACCDKPLWLYDSFEGLPERQSQDAGALKHFERGALKVDVTEVVQRFVQHKLREPFVCKSWFNAIPQEKLPERISFAHLDGDLYQSMRDCIRLVYPRLVDGGACVIDDYGWSGLPGAKLAVDEYMRDKTESVRLLFTGNPEGFQAVIIKLSLGV